MYNTGPGPVKAIDNVSLRIKQGSFVVVYGPSGSGKTTLLMTIAGMQRPSSGRVVVDGNDLYSMGIRARTRFRAKTIGFVFQMFYLLPYLNVLENITVGGYTAAGNRDKAETNKLLEQLNLSNRVLHKPSELSAGEKQRVAIARALFNRPKLILADEPTGNLDPDNAGAVLGYLSDFHQSGGTVILITHRPQAQRLADQVVYMRNGRID